VNKEKMKKMKEMKKMMLSGREIPLTGFKPLLGFAGMQKERTVKPMGDSAGRGAPVCAPCNNRAHTQVRPYGMSFHFQKTVKRTILYIYMIAALGAAGCRPSAGRGIPLTGFKTLLGFAVSTK
jgi:hypothetical protein